MNQYNVAITGLNAADVPSPGIGVIRSLRLAERETQDIKIKIIGLAYELLCSVSYLDDLVDEVYHLPFPQEDEGKYLSRMLEITEKTRIDILIPNLDFEIAVMSRLEAELRDLGVKLLVPSESALNLAKKENLPKLPPISEVEVPFSLVFSDRRQIAATAANFTYPLMVKAANGEASVVYSLEEAIVFSIRLMALWGTPLIMQKYIKGDEYSVTALADRRQRVLEVVGMKKILKSRNGATWMGVTAKDESLIKLAKKIIEKLKWVGPIEIEFIKEQASGKYYLIEINPRFPAWIYLAAQAGSNLPMATVKTLLHHRLEPFSAYKSGILFARSAVDIPCDIERLGKLATKKELIYHADKN